MSLLCLPSVKKLNRSAVSPLYSDVVDLPVLADFRLSLENVAKDISKLDLTVGGIIGSIQTPVVYWLGALKVFPQAKLYLQQKEDKIVEVDSLNLMKWILYSEDKAPTLKNETPKEKIIKASSESISIPPIITETKAHKKPASKPKQQDQKQIAKNGDSLANEVYKYTCWGKEAHKSEITRLESQLAELSLVKPHLINKLKRAQNEGEIVFQGSLLLEKKTKGSFDELAITKWIDEEYKDEAPRVRKWLHTKLEKLKSRKLANTERYKNKKQHKCQLPLVALNNGIHPCAIRSLPLEDHYDVYIDETGQSFSALDKNTPQGETLGKYVAIVIPRSVELKPLPQFHGSSETPARVDQALATLINKQVGILGFTASDIQAQTFMGWINGVIQLVRWVAYLLPSSASKRTLNVMIEQRSGFTEAMSLDVLEAMIFDELRTLDKQFENLVIRLQFTGKDNDYLTYADAVAFTWGSPSKDSKTRLKNSNLQRYCLFNASDNAIEKLYLMANTKLNLTPKEWYALITGIPEIGESWLTNYVDKVQVRVKKTPELWHQYLDHVRDLLAQKNYKTASVALALQFLSDSEPTSEQLSLALKLRLVSAQLSVKSHLGVLDKPLYDQAVELINTIKKEDAQLACEGALRLFSMSTNVLASYKLVDLISLWLSEPMLNFGKSNFAKLHSTMGQIHAFKGDNTQAVTHFEKAINLFGELSDKTQAEKEVMQTSCYLLTVLLADDNAKQTATKTLESLLLQSNKTMTTLALSLHFPYVHHTILKAITLRPEWFTSYQKEYLQAPEKWLMDDFYPWQWITLYRGLNMVFVNTEQGLEILHDAYARCLSQTNRQGDIFHWMQLVMQQLLLQFDDQVEEIDAEILNAISSKLPNAKTNQLEALASNDIDSIRNWLDSVLPFNFH